MKSFRYRAYAAGGAVETGVLEASSRDEAARLLARKGSRPFEIAEDGPNSTAETRAIIVRAGRRVDVEALFRDIDVLMNAGFDVDGALAATRSGRRPFEVRAIDAALAHLKSGGSLADAFTRIPGISEDMVHLLESGESSGRVDQVVAAIASDLAARRARRNAMFEALVYPAFLLAMMVGAMGMIIFYLVPSLAPVFEGAPEKTPLMLSVLAGVGDFLGDNSLILAAAGLGLIALVIALWRSEALSAIAIQLSLKLPLLGPFLRDRAVSRYLGAAALLTGHGVPINRALQLAVKACPLKALQPALAAVRDKVVAGGSFVAALTDANLLDAASLSILGIGEEANRLPQMLDRTGYLLERRTAQTLDRILKILTPLITIVMGVLIGGLVISVMTSILSINDLAFE